MFHSRNLNKKINRLHKRCLLIIFNDKITSFEQLLDNDNSVSIHHRNTQALAIEMYKVTNWLAPQILNELYVIHCNLQLHQFAESVSYTGPKICELSPPTFRQINTPSLAG